MNHDPYGGGIRPSQVSPARQRLARLIHFIHFGRICNLHVRGGEPAFNPAPLVIRTVKLGPGGATRNAPRPVAADAYLPGAVVDLLEHLARMGDGVVGRIEIANGLPLAIEFHDAMVG